MLKKTVQAIISVALVLTLCISTCSAAFAASSGSKEYVKEVFISYGKTADLAKEWLTNSGYQVVDYNLNEGADDIRSTKRAVYLGYKTTTNADEAITDMKLMNMKGDYSIQDYQILLEEQKSSIQLFLDQFKISVQEYRKNYEAGQKRAIAAHDLLNMLYDDDTKQNMGDLLLNKTKEEYTDKEYSALSKEVQGKTADMTTILMQGNADAVLAIEQTIAMATDDSNTPWLSRYQSAKTYDEMVDDLMDKEDLTVNEAQKQLAAQYDENAKTIAGNIDDYEDYLGVYTNGDVKLTNTKEEIDAYLAECQKEDTLFSPSEWAAAGTQYEVLTSVKKDDITLYDLLFGDEYDVQNEDRTMLYPLVASLSEGQRACLGFLPLTQLFMLGINNDAAVASAMKDVSMLKMDELKNVSVYDGIDRSIFGSSVAMTSDAMRLQNSSGKNAMESWSDFVSTTSIVLFSCLCVSVAATIASWTLSPYLMKIAPGIEKSSYAAGDLAYASRTVALDAKSAGNMERYEKLWKDFKVNKAKSKALYSRWETCNALSRALKVAGMVMICVTAVLMGFTVWSYIQDMKKYYNTTFTPIPRYMVNEAVDESDNTTYTYYKAVRCNREDFGMNTDQTKPLGDYGDLNGDVGRQWVALYTTKDAAAGDPITADFMVQYDNTSIPSNYTALSMFGESTAQNLTNKKAGYTYADSKDGIYLFYGTHSSALAGSVITNGSYVLVGGISALVGAAVAFFIGRSVGGKKKNKKEEALENA